MYRSATRQLVRCCMLMLLVASSMLTSGNTPAHATPREWLYTGVVTTDVQITNLMGRSLGVFSYTTDVDVMLADPQRRQHSRETNPFHLVIQSTPLNNEPGEISIVSSTVVDGVVFQYWRYQRNRRFPSQFSGRLDNNHTAEAIALNLLTLPTEIAPNNWMAMPQALANGTTLTGRFDRDGTLYLQITGNTTQGDAPFTSKLVARPAR